MIVKLSEKYRITTDPHNFILEELRETTNPKTKETRKAWKQIGYFGKFEHIIHFIFKNELVSNDNLTIAQIKDILKELERIVDKAAAFRISRSRL